MFGPQVAGGALGPASPVATLPARSLAEGFARRLARLPNVLLDRLRDPLHEHPPALAVLDSTRALMRLFAPFGAQGLGVEPTARDLSLGAEVLGLLRPPD